MPALPPMSLSQSPVCPTSQFCSPLQEQFLSVVSCSSLSRIGAVTEMPLVVLKGSNYVVACEIAATVQAPELVAGTSVIGRQKVACYACLSVWELQSPAGRSVHARWRSPHPGVSGGGVSFSTPFKPQQCLKAVSSQGWSGRKPNGVCSCIAECPVQ